MEDTVDLLKIKIEKAKRELPEETQNAIAAVDWRAAILGLRGKKGYTFEQLGDLELETELLLAGLVSPENYPKELGNRMRIGSAEVDQLVSEMNEKVFKKIREELIKNTERKRIFASKISPPTSIGFEEPIANNFAKDLGNKAGIVAAPAVQTIPTKVLSKDIVAERAILRKDGIEILDKPDPNIPAPAANIEISSAEKLPMPEKLEITGGVHPILAQKLSSTFQIPVVKTEHSLDNLTKTTPAPSSYAGKADPYRLSPDE